MSSYLEPEIKVFVSAEDLTAKQFTLVKLTASQAGKKISSAAAGDKAIGVVMNAPNVGDDAEVAMLGDGALLKIKGTCSAGDSLAAEASGKGKVGTAGQWCPAIALDDAVDGDVISVVLNGHYFPDGIGAS